MNKIVPKNEQIIKKEAFCVKNKRVFFRLARFALIRLLFLAFLVWIFIRMSQNSECRSLNTSDLFYLIPVFIILIESLYICIKRNGNDFKWFSLSSLCFTYIGFSFTLELKYYVQLYVKESECELPEQCFIVLNINCFTIFKIFIN